MYCFFLIFLLRLSLSFFSQEAINFEAFKFLFTNCFSNHYNLQLILKVGSASLQLVYEEHLNSQGCKTHRQQTFLHYTNIILYRVKNFYYFHLFLKLLNCFYLLFKLFFQISPKISMIYGLLIFLYSLSYLNYQLCSDFFETKYFHY